MNDVYEALQGQIEALSLVVTALVSAIPVAQARAALVQLEIGFESHCESEREDRAADLNRTLIREAMVESYVGLLRAAAGSPSR